MARLLHPVLLLALLACTASAATVEFNRDIRPILSERCFTCHGPDEKSRKTKLRLDLETSAKGPLANKKTSIVPGKPDQSELFRRLVTTKPAERMPPAYLGHDPLPKAEIDLIRQWIEQGASWQGHWSFEPLRRPSLPETQQETWTRNPIDRFILARLEREGLSPSPEADPQTLARRVALDLTGLPPDPEALQAFLRDPSDTAYEAFVDRLLAGPRYAERMAIRWLEAARFSDTNGYQTDGIRDMYRWRDWVIDAFDRNMPFDRFTIEQIAGDLLPNPTRDQQIATAFHRNHRTSAEGGIVEEEFRVEYVADRVETTSTVWLGLTTGCARCHDHKYDPITQKDFYSLFAFFNNVPERGLVYNFGNEQPYIQAPTPEHEEQLAEHDAAIQAAQKQWDSLQPELARRQQDWEQKLARGRRSKQWWPEDRQVLHIPLDGGRREPTVCGKNAKCEVPTEDGLLRRARRFDGAGWIELDQKLANFNFRDRYTLSAWIKPESPDGAILSRMEDYWEGEGYALLLKDGKLRFMVTRRFTDISLRIESKEPVKLNEWQHVAITSDGYRKAAGFHLYVNGIEQEKHVEFDELTYPYGPKEPFRIGAGAGLRFRGLIDDVRVYREPLNPQEIAALGELSPLNELAAIPPAKRTPAQIAKLRLAFFDRELNKDARVARLRLEMARDRRRLYNDSIPTVMVMREGPPRPAFVLTRGAYDAPGDPVDPRVPGFLPPLPENAPRNRLGLAQWLVSETNPLTPRVTVNRFWQMFLGAGLVKTSNDFGAQGERPSHPELLDWLAVEFRDSGWDVKRLLKLIVTSSTYRQSSRVTPELLDRDPENRLLARGPRYRLPADMLRDQALFVSGLLVEKTGGPSVKPYQPAGLWQELAGGSGYTQGEGEDLYRRSLYTFWKRTVAPPNMVNFDSPTRETCTVHLTRTNTPLQALNLMNDVAYLEAARKLAERMIVEGGSGKDNRLRYGWQIALARTPQPDELAIARNLLDQYLAHYRRQKGDAKHYLDQGESEVAKGVRREELAAYTGVASLLLNLDEMVTKE